MRGAIIGLRTFAAVAIAAVLASGACSGDGGGASPLGGLAGTASSSGAPSGGPVGGASGGPSGGPVRPTGLPPLRAVRVQLGWVMQAQFAGYLAAIEQGYYEAAGIEVTLVEGGPDVMPHEVGSAPGSPEFTVAWVPSVLQARASGASDLVDIAQIFQRSGSLSISRKASGVSRAVDFRGLKVGVLGAGRELEVIAGASRAGLVPGTDLTLRTQGPNMGSFLNGDLDVAQATIYNEYALVLEAKNPATGTLYRLNDLEVINWNDEGTAMLQDAVFARASWLAEGDNEGLARDFLGATFRGWMFCRDDPDECVRYTVDAGAAKGAGHQAWMMNEVNGLIWPSPDGIGVMEPDAWDETVTTLVSAAIIPGPAPAEAYRTDLAEAALASLAEFDTTGESFVKRDVTITPGGR